MNYGRLVVPSANQVSTSPNKENVHQAPDLSFCSKGELIRAYKTLWMENQKALKKADKYLDESLFFKQKCIELNGEIESLTTKDEDKSQLFLRAV